MPPPSEREMRFIEIRGHLVELDDSIADVVLGLNGMGIDTVGSCEGHRDGERHPYPWVGINQFLEWFGRERLDRLQGLLVQFNNQSDIPWELTPGGVTPAADILTTFGITPDVRKEFVDATQIHAVPISPDNLDRLQQSARALGTFLLTNIRATSLK